MGQSGKLRGLGLRDPGSNPGSPIGYPQTKRRGYCKGNLSFDILANERERGELGAPHRVAPFYKILHQGKILKTNFVTK